MINKIKKVNQEIANLMTEIESKHPEFWTDDIEDISTCDSKDKLLYYYLFKAFCTLNDIYGVGK